MKSILTLAAIIAFLILAAVFAPVVVEAASKRITKTVVRRSRQVERSFAADCSGESRASNCAGASDCDRSASTCDGAARASRRTVEITIR